eukprot:6147962-Prymnesium_polylepis.3
MACPFPNMVTAPRGRRTAPRARENFGALPHGGLSDGTALWVFALIRGAGGACLHAARVVPLRSGRCCCVLIRWG